MRLRRHGYAKNEYDLLAGSTVQRTHSLATLDSESETLLPDTQSSALYTLPPDMSQTRLESHKANCFSHNWNTDGAVCVTNQSHSVIRVADSVMIVPATQFR